MSDESKLAGIDTAKPKRPKYGGRKKGTPNKLSLTIKESVLEVFATLGGVDAMADWARANPSEYYKIAARLIPTEQQITGAGGRALLIRVGFVAPSATDAPANDSR